MKSRGKGLAIDHLTNAAAIVTGAASGIGRAAALALGGAGSLVIAVDRDRRRCAGTVEEITTAGGKAVALHADVSRSAEMTTMADEARRIMASRHTPLQVVVHAAGILSSALVTDMDDGGWQSEIDTNLTSTFYCYRQFIPELVARGSGAVITISSSAAKAFPKQFPAYAASKAGVVALHASVSKQFVGTGVAFFTICPGYVDTPMGRAAFEVQVGRAPDSEELARFVAPAAVAGVIVGLTRPEMRPASGSVIDIVLL